MKNDIKISILKLEHLGELPLPSYATINSAGMDLIAAIKDYVVLKHMERMLIPTGIAIALPEGYEAQIRPRSSLAYKNGITVINAPGTIDADYRGEIFVPIINFAKEDFTIKRGMRIAQIVISQYAQINWNILEELEKTDRNTGGFGSTGNF